MGSMQVIRINNIRLCALCQNLSHLWWCALSFQTAAYKTALILRRDRLYLECHHGGPKRSSRAIANLQQYSSCLVHLHAQKFSFYIFVQVVECFNQRIHLKVNTLSKLLMAEYMMSRHTVALGKWIWNRLHNIGLQRQGKNDSNRLIPRVNICATHWTLYTDPNWSETTRARNFFSQPVLSDTAARDLQISLQVYRYSERSMGRCLCWEAHIFHVGAPHPHAHHKVNEGGNSQRKQTWLNVGISHMLYISLST